MADHNSKSDDITENATDFQLNAKFKCRFCGEIFDTASRPKVDGLREGRIFKSILTADERQYPLRYAIHFAGYYAEDPHWGFADFIGFSVNNGEEES